MATNDPLWNANRGAAECSEEEEEKFIAGQLDHFEQFLQQLEGRSQNLPQRARARYDALKAKLRGSATTTEGLRDDGMRTGADDVGGTAGQRHNDQSTGGSRRSSPGRNRNARLQTGISADLDKGTSSIGSSSHSSDGESRHDSNPIPRVKKEAPRCDSSRHEEDDVDLKTVLRAWDPRSFPEMKPFDEQRGESLRAYLRRFEEYCQNQYKGGREGWSVVLEKHLTGQLLRGFRVLRHVDDTYEDSKEKLLTFYDQSERDRKEERRRAFHNAQYGHTDNVHLHGAQLESLFIRAYPRKAVETSKTLRDKFISTLPRLVGTRCGNYVQEEEAKGMRVTWTALRRYAQNCARTSPITCKGHTDAGEEIVIQVGQEKQSTDETPRKRKPNQGVGNAAGILKRADTTRLGRADTRGSVNVGRERYNERWSRDRIVGPARTFQQATPKCYHCGRLGHMARVCRRRLGTCFRCGGSNHWAKDCSDTGREAWRGGSRSSSLPPRERANRNNQGDRTLRRNSQQLGTKSSHGNNNRNFPLNDFAPL